MRRFCWIFLILLFPGIRSAMAFELSVDEAVQIALKNNLGMQLQKEQVVSSGGQITQAEGEFDTLLSADAATGSSRYSSVLSGEESEADLTVAGAGLAGKFKTGTAYTVRAENRREKNDLDTYLIDPAYSSDFAATVRQPLLQGRGTEVQTALIESAEKQLQAEEYLVESRAADIAAAAKSAYWELVYSWQDIEVQKLSLSLAEKLLEETRLQIEAGRLASIEIFQPQSEVARREQQLIVGERAIGVAEDSLKILLNEKNWSRSIQPLDKPEFVPAHVVLEQVMENALANRPDLLAVGSRIGAAELLAGRRKNYTLPDLGIFGSAGIGASADGFGNSYSNIGTHEDRYWKFGVTLSMPLENRYARGNYQQAQSAVRKAKIQREMLRQEIRRKVRSSVRDVELAAKAIDATRKTSLATAKRLEAEEIKFASGKSTTFDVLAAQEAYATTLRDEYRAKVIYVQALAEVDRVQGLVSLRQTE